MVAADAYVTPGLGRASAVARRICQSDFSGEWVGWEQCEGKGNKHDLIRTKYGAFPIHVEVSESCLRGEGLERVAASVHYTMCGN